MARRTNAPMRIQAALQARNEELVLPWAENETLDHWVLKLMAIRMLTAEGYRLSAFAMEKAVMLRRQPLRPDLLVDQGPCPVWVECRACPREKLLHIARHFHGRLLHVANWWWGSNDEVQTRIADELRWYRALRSNDRTGQESDVLGLVPGVEHWHCDLHSPPIWGLTVDAQGRLFFLQTDEIQERPLRHWRFVWAVFERTHGRCPYQVEALSRGTAFVPPARFLEYASVVSPGADDFVRKQDTSMDYLPNLQNAVDLLLAWGFLPQEIRYRQRVRVGTRILMPYLVAEGQAGRVWVERHTSARLEYVAEHFAGKVIVLPDEHSGMPDVAAAGVDYWHTVRGRVTGWGFGRAPDGQLRIFHAPEVKGLPWLAVDTTWATLTAGGWSPPVLTSGVGRAAS